MTGIRFDFDSDACGGPYRNLSAKEFAELLGRERVFTPDRRSTISTGPDPASDRPLPGRSGTAPGEFER